MSDVPRFERYAVLDANILVYVITDPAESNSARLWNRLVESHQIVMPALARWEVTNAFYRAGRLGQVAPDDVNNGIVAIRQLGIEFSDNFNDHIRAVNLARRFDFKLAYDAHYLAMAERLNAAFWTADKALYAASGSTFNWVNLVER